MNTSPRRSARISQRSGQGQPYFRTSFPTSLPPFSASSSSSSSSSTLSSAHPSPTTNVNASSAQQQEQARLQLHSQFLQPQPFFNAPRPSPSAGEIDTFWGGHQTQSNYLQMPQNAQNTNAHSSSSSQQQQTHGNQSQQQQPQQQQQISHHNSFSQQGQSHNNNPGQLPPDFLAEAAKRAQMACLMRDLGDVTL